MKRKILANDAIPMPKRCQLAQAIIFSRLVFGVEIWPELHPKHETKINCFMQKVYRAIAKKVSRGADLHFSTLEVEATVICMKAHSMVRMQRLRYFRKLGEEAPMLLGDLLQRDDRESRAPWLNLIREDLKWMLDMQDKSNISVDPNDIAGWWQEVIGMGKRWDKLVTNLTAKEAMQNHIVAKQKWGQETATPGVTLQCARASGSHSCMRCSARFFGQAALANHMWKRHGVHAGVRAYIDGTCCGSCQKDFLTLQRIRQHLQYATKCHQHLQSIWFPMPAGEVEPQICLKTTHRVPWCYHQGPQLPTREEWEMAAPWKSFPPISKDLEIRECLELCRDAAKPEEAHTLDESWQNLVL